jgi:hypothetical protein
MACKRSAVRSCLPPPIFRVLVDFRKCSFRKSKVKTPSSRGLGHYPFTVGTGVRIPVGSPSFCSNAQQGTSWKRSFVRLTLGSQEQKFPLPGVVVQLVRIPACHAGGRGFESRPLRQIGKPPIARWAAFSLVFFKSGSIQERDHLSIFNLPLGNALRPVHSTARNGQSRAAA